METMKRLLIIIFISLTAFALYLAIGNQTIFSNSFNKEFSADEFLDPTFIDLKDALWITDEKKLPEHDSLFYLDNPAPIFRKTFRSKNDIKKATLYITAAGYYEATINGERIGKNMLDPAWTDYSKRVYVAEYDITSQINKDKNCLGVTLGNGFYNPLPLKKWGRRNLRVDLAKVDKPTFIAKLVLKYKNGDRDEIITNDTWKYSYGPIIKNSVYIGVAYNAQQEIKDWNKPNFKDDLWSKSIICEAPGGRVQKSFFPPVQITDKITPISINSLENGGYIVDMGVNLTGTYNIKLFGKKGDTIVFRFGERIYDNGTLNPMTTVIGQIKKKGIGGPGAPEVAWQTDSYIIGDNTESIFQPKFTYHTYRYMEILGLRQKPEIKDIVGLALNTNVKDYNSFNCSSDLLNSIQKASKRTFVSNLVSVQSDCPAREKFGYGGDLNAISESYINNYDMQTFYRKTVYDWVDAMNDSTFVDTAPYTGVKYCGISWESAFLTTQYNMYLYYNDTAIIKELYDLDNAWMEKVGRIHPEGLVKSGLSDHGSQEPVPLELTGTAHYLQCAEIMETFANVMNDKEQASKYRALANKLRELIKNEFWDKPISEKINRQTLFSTLLYHNIVPAKALEAAKDSLHNALNNGPSGHLNTGIFGTKYMLETVSKHISPTKIYNIANSTEYPGWGFMIDRGATTIWETWKESDNIFSNCHPMLASISEWFYRWLGGIQPNSEYPGFKRFILSPSTPEGLDFVNTKYKSPYGTIVSNWKREASGAYKYDFVIPEKSMAQVKLPISTSQEIKIYKKDIELESKNIEGLETGRFNLQAGTYTIFLLPKL
ncbi:family 78 glycoside hydrolase catalytic domain [Flavivirga aquimarina]|uniref:alpha-L-rhamnosidase n=1 Tax=Flavivirga aquimarina TaxID=2027862 RepID=A0ABT8WC71_9FLAO|nr:family 78 glycoside hydrolase catalytic domain [Flavivirga aquimarina]MDO5970632.1 family 78 glycoside hydrolase catalytic domain [Flavivirga aquimarina]